jgi:hypothetical protein
MLPLSRASVFEVVKALGIRTVKWPGPGGRGRVAWVSSADAERISGACLRVHRGDARIADLGQGLQRRATRATLQTLPRAVPAGSGDAGDAGPLLARMEAAERAMRTGLGLTTAEVAFILGVQPGQPELTRGGIVARRTGRNGWILESADAGDSADAAPATVARRARR